MRIAVIGATGTAGSRTTAAAQRLGHDVIEISRSTGVDLLTGAGLTEALAGAEVAIDTSNAFPNEPDTDPVRALEGATRNVVEACRAAGVEHLVFLSICNIDDPVFDEFPYYLAKRAQEQVVRQSSLAATIVRTTQWHEFATNPAAVMFDGDQVTVQDWLIQPIAADTVADALIESASTRPSALVLTGPESIRLPELTARVLAARGDLRQVVAAEPGLRPLAEGALLAPEEAEVRPPGIARYLETIA